MGDASCTRVYRAVYNQKNVRAIFPALCASSHHKFSHLYANTLAPTRWNLFACRKSGCIFGSAVSRVPHMHVYMHKHMHQIGVQRTHTGRQTNLFFNFDCVAKFRLLHSIFYEYSHNFCHQRWVASSSPRSADALRLHASFIIWSDTKRCLYAIPVWPRCKCKRGVMYVGRHTKNSLALNV